MREVSSLKRRNLQGQLKDIEGSKYRIKTSYPTKLEKDITIDLIESLVSKRIMGKLPPNVNNKGMSKLSIFSMVCSIILVLLMIIGAISSMGGGKGADGTGNFTIFKDLTVFKNLQLHQKSHTLMSIIYELKRLVYIIDKYKGNQNISKHISPISKNFLFYGMPGTGKTFIVKKVAYYFDIELRIRRELKKMGKKRTELTYEILEKTEPAVVLFLASPSSLIDKWVGETEKNIRNLFKTARKYAKQYSVIIFIDEIDSFFSERDKNTSEHSINVKSEWLDILDGINTNIEDKIFFIGATNRIEAFDDAFKRRLKTRIEFKIPSEEEIIGIIMKFTEGRLWFNKTEVAKIAKKLASVHVSQSDLNMLFLEIDKLRTTKCVRYSYESINQAVENYIQTRKGSKASPSGSDDLKLDKEFIKKMESNLRYTKIKQRITC